MILPPIQKSTFHDYLLQLPIDKRYEAFCFYYHQFNECIVETAAFLGISYNAFKKAINTLKPHVREYDTKVKNEHEIFKYPETLSQPSITGKELALKFSIK